MVFIPVVLSLIGPKTYINNEIDCDKVVPINSKPKSGGWIGGKAKGRSTNHVRRGIHLEIMLGKFF